MVDKRAVISMSGGLDSTCLALHLLNQGYEVKAYAFNYGQKHDIELKKLRKNIKFLQKKGLEITLQIVDLRDVFSDSRSSLTGNGEIPKAEYDIENQKSTVVENRNVIFSSIIYGKALAWSKAVNKEVKISLGIHAGDHSIYPDCTPESHEMSRTLFRISNWGSELVDYIAPFVNSNKGEVLNFGLEAMSGLEFSGKDVKYVLKNTHSCYDPDEQGRPCGICATCLERLNAFKDNNIKDPVEYQTKN